MAIIEEDIKRQLRLESNNVDQPLSEAYLNGRPQKRRKVGFCASFQNIYSLSAVTGSLSLQQQIQSYNNVYYLLTILCLRF